MNPFSLLKKAGVFFLFLVLLGIIHLVNQKRQKEILAHVWINPKKIPSGSTRIDAKIAFNEDAFFEQMMIRIVRHRDSQLVVFLQAKDSVLVAEKILKNQRFILHP